MKVYLIHPNYPFKMEPRIEVRIKKGLPEGKAIGTPNISYKEIGIDDSYITNDKYALFNKEHLWKRFLSEYHNNLKKLKENLKVIEIQTDEIGIVKDLSWLDEEVYLGGCFLEGCLHNGIRRIQTELLNRRKEPIINLIPEVTLCHLQPAQVTFMEELNDMNSIDFHYKKEFHPKILNNKIKLVSLETLINKTRIR